MIPEFSKDGTDVDLRKQHAKLRPPSPKGTGEMEGTVFPS